FAFSHSTDDRSSTSCVNALDWPVTRHHLLAAAPPICKFASSRVVVCVWVIIIIIIIINIFLLQSLFSFFVSLFLVLFLSYFTNKRHYYCTREPQLLRLF